MKEELEELSLLSEESAKNVKVMVGNGITHVKLKGCLISHVGDTRFSHPQVVVYHLSMIKIIVEIKQGKNTTL